MDIRLLIKLFEENRDIEKAIPMQSYLKDHFPFLGIKAPERRALLKEYFNETGLLKQEFNPDFVEALWDLEEREYQAAALDYIGKFTRKLDKSHLSLVEKLITTKSWWDTVDMLAAHPAGAIAAKNPEVIPEKIEGWATSENMWLRRAAILFQLKYKTSTNEDLLYRYIMLNNDSKEFFIQKAIGWALREYSKTNPESVKRFIESNTLARLSIREGSKYIG
ncbi:MULTISPECIES: DNA alkylation repair protein [Cytobacillus]|jgi:3-methyladenine DNA glycosylase AlkD|uniref:DNA alkylation repair protein n=1 Tax=Cytobacillus oceanisediminis 2691 TaxID=1196031 RepID=A0A169G111_9BACI|nr:MULTISPECIES: DNA alkylation repair protein [Cytobacillus]MCS0825487.1 DNA alkylation repair protein [Cytobacillus firmus]AND42535.1 DNA alkylation repair protein [Cytobacillus oceanisediminis 2691]MBU8730675.1 DNA alkylation repair protein [Cytobacillus oceanisediminis]MCM3391778.1 DNA alkylation repair protein [Cytobacillus oceanisediminis]UQX53548.1 DNA alkylation repair protein [Cytobacillus pseudoceanisediminis]